ncbi:MAG: HIT family protein [Erysipelotrichaceae bacterium]|nr:HIT family protein [Erysipelotrichaceae bacterium]
MCIFCEIIKGNIPGVKVYEDDDVLAILDISQVTKGHTLVMPKKHVADIIEADEETVLKCMKVVHELTPKIVNNLGAEGCNILNNCKAVAGQSVEHLHFHIIPRYSENDAVTIAFNESEKQDLAAVAAQILK